MINVKKHYGSHARFLGSELTANLHRSFRIPIAANTSARSGNFVRVMYQVHSTQQCEIQGSSIQIQGVGEDFGAAPVRLTFNNGSNSIIPAVGTFVLSDWIAFTFTRTTAYLIHITLNQVGGNNGWRYQAGAPVSEYYKDSVADDETMDQNVAGYTDDQFFPLVCGIDVADVAEYNYLISRRDRFRTTGISLG